MSEVIAETDLWNRKGVEGRLSVTADFRVLVDERLLDLNNVSGLAVASVVKHPDELIPKTKLLELAEEVSPGTSPLDNSNSRLSEQGNLTRGLNSFRRLSGNIFSKNVFLLGSLGSPHQCWYLATDLRDQDAVSDRVTTLARDSDLPQSDSIIRSLVDIFPADKKVKEPDTPLQIYNLNRLKIIPTRLATIEENRELFRMICGTNGGVGLGAEFTETDILEWKDAKGIGKMDIETIVNAAVTAGYIRVEKRLSESGRKHEYVFFRK